MKKAQFSIDYLTTYTMAFTAFLAVIMFLTYSYVSPDTFIRDECRVSDTFNCNDALIENNEITLILRNNLPDPLNITRFECFSDEDIDIHTENFEVDANSVFELNCELPLEIGRKASVGFSISFVEKDKTFLKSTSGNLVSTNRE
ncbi:MAG: hypothetical protein ACMXX6_00550 [Candidatus Woesearchaeota archaeon]